MSLRLILSTLLAAALALLGAWGAGHVAGQAAGAAACAEGQAEGYRDLLDESAKQLHQAQATSTELFKRLARQHTHDEKTTQELRDALAETAADRTACRFAAGVMQQLEDARQRAARATTGGLDATLPPAGGDGG
ncbi:hypothetical protein [Ectopseudomonas oleovorans]|uniref:Secreted protein n=1 Tax=Ectopseudomonas oleovorans (strain CECT 5344) TaxID=1182590 RepID=W6R7N8_ECTO5|nr:hypothetical protein [Pseudomonas oleovorans]CDM42401.1 hypothetical protein BN5_3859 [Pseudomonas oleovorans CECT 5344]CDR93024.1 hypothetical protein PPSAL_3800 [Pseudomonas oleovorans]